MEHARARVGPGVQATSPFLRDPVALYHLPCFKASNCRICSDDGKRRWARPKPETGQEAQSHTHSIDTPVVGLAPSQRAHFLARLPIVDVYLSEDKNACGLSAYVWTLSAVSTLNEPFLTSSVSAVRVPDCDSKKGMNLKGCCLIEFRAPFKRRQRAVCPVLW